MIKKSVCVLMVLLVLAAALSGCSSGKTAQNIPGKTESALNRENRQEGMRRDTKDSGTQENSVPQSQNQIIGKVTSIVGNEVELELGTMSRESGTASGEFVSSGETKTLLIPVGLSLSASGTGVMGEPGGAGGAGISDAQQGTAQAGKTAPGTPPGTVGAGTTGSRSGSAKTGSATKTTAGSAAATVKRTSGFSSISAGMVLRISQKEISGTLTVVKVTVVSK